MRILSFFFSFLAVCCLTNCQWLATEPKGESEEERQGFLGAQERMHRLKANQITNRIDLKDVYAGIEAADALRYRSSGLRDECELPPLVWEELGPDNVGGRTRALMIDRNNPNHLLAGSVAGGLFISNDGGYNWLPFSGNDTLSTLSVGSIAQAADGTIFLGTGEYYENGFDYGYDNSKSPGYGIYRSTDGAQTFHLLESTRPQPFDGSPTNYNWAFIINLAVHPTDANIVYAGTNTGLWKSTDKGMTWSKPTGLPGNSSRIWDVQMTSAGQLFFTLSSSIYTTTDGVNFTNITTTPGSGLPSDGDRRELAVSATDPNYVYLVTTAGGCIEKVFQSKNAGQNWTVIGTGHFDFFNPCADYCQCWYDLTIGVDPFDPEHLFLGGVTLWAWYGEEGWQQIDNVWGGPGDPYYVHADKHFILFDPQQQNVAYVCGDGGVFRTDDAHQINPKFKELNKNYNVTQFYSVAASHEGEVMGGTQDNGTNFIGFNFLSMLSSEEIYGGDGGYSEISNIKPLILFAEYVNGTVVRSTNGGSSFGNFFDENIDADHDGEPDAGAPFIAPFFLWEDLTRYYYGDGEIDAKFFMCDNAKRVWMVREPLDAGIVPEWKSIATFQSGILASIAMVDAERMYALSDAGRLMRIVNLNNTSPTATNIPNVPFSGRYATGVAVEEGNAQKVIVSAGNYGNDDYIWMTENAMSASPTFTSLQYNLPPIPIYDVVVNPANPQYYLVIGTELGMWSFNSLTNCWTEHNEGIGRVPVYRVRWEEMRSVGCQVLYLGTHGRGLFRSTTLTYPFCDTEINFANGIGTVHPSTAVANTLTLAPNPMTQQTALSYTLSEPTSVEVRLYNISGRLVQQQNLGQQAATTHRFTIERNDLPAGTYLVQLRLTGGKTMQQKLVIR